jgi:hypothetical protein
VTTKSWLLRVVAHLRGRDKPDPLLQRADAVIDALHEGDVRVVIVARNARALAELRRLERNERR